MRRGALVLLTLAACGGSKTGEDGALVVVAAFADGPLAGAHVLAVDPQTGAALAPAAVTNALGSATLSVREGSVAVRAFAAGFVPYPAPGVVSPAFDASRQQPTHVEAWLAPRQGPSDVISGTVQDVRGPVAGALVLGAGTSFFVAGLSDSTGAFQLQGVPAGSLSLQALHVGGGTADAIAATAGASGVALKLQDATATATGTLQYDGTNRSTVNVALADPATGELVPGLSARSSGNTFQVTHVPVGRYVVLPSPDADGLVVTPAGLPAFIQVGPGQNQPTARLIDAVELLQPTNASTTLTPAQAAATPVLQWNAYPGADAYVPEVLDGAGQNLWGGFDAQNQPRFTTEASQPFATYGEQGDAVPLKAGRLYRLRVWALQNGSILSVSEPCRGLFRVVP